MANTDPLRRPSAKELLKVLGDDEDDEQVAQNMAGMSVEETTDAFGGLNFSGDEGLEPSEYALQHQYYQAGETSAIGAIAYGATSRDGVPGGSGPVSPPAHYPSAVVSHGASEPQMMTFPRDHTYQTYSGTYWWSPPRGTDAYTGPGTTVPEQPTMTADPSGAVDMPSGKKDKKKRHK
jgi:hypothetical protein